MINLESECPEQGIQWSSVCIDQYLEYPKYSEKKKSISIHYKVGYYNWKISRY